MAGQKHAWKTAHEYPRTVPNIKRKRNDLVTPKTGSMEEHEYKPVHGTHLHYAQIFRRNKLLAEARNTIGSRSRGCGWNDYTLHAECAVIKRLGDLTKLKGCVLLVIRVNKQGEIMPSTQALQKQIAQLSALDRIALVEDILQGLDAPDAAVDALWAAEAESRLAAYRTGHVKAIPLSEVLAKYKLS